MGEAKHVRLRVGVIGLGRLWETRHKPSLARLHDRFRVTAVYDQVYRRAEIEAEQLGCAPAEGLAALVERPDVDVVYLLSPQWFGLHPVDLACAAGKPVYCALPLAGDLAELEALARRVDESGHRLHARVRPPVLPGDPAAQGAAGHDAGAAPADPRPLPALRLRPLRHAGPDHPDRARPAADRPGELPARLVLVPVPGAARSSVQRVAVRGDPRRARASRARISRASSPRSPAGAIGPDRLRPLSPAPLGRGQPVPAAPGFQVFAERGPPGSSCPSGSSGGTRAARTRSGCRWSRRSATCSTTSSTGWSAATSRWRRRSATPWRSPGSSSDLKQSQGEGLVVRASRPGEEGPTP